MERMGILKHMSPLQIRQFISYAFTHLKIIGYSNHAKVLFDKVGITSELDKRCVELTGKSEVKAFTSVCRGIRFWEREAVVMP